MGSQFKIAVSLPLVIFSLLVFSSFANAAWNLTSTALQPVNNSNFSAGATIGLQGNCSTNATLTNATAFLYYANNASLFITITNTSDIVNATAFNISFASSSNNPLNFTWNVMCEDNESGFEVSNNLTFNLLTSYFLTSTLFTPLDASAQPVGNVISLIGSCQSNATLTGGRFWVYRSTGADYANYANTSAITNDTMFSASFTIPNEATTWYWNLECSDNHGQTANASSNFSFAAVSAGGGSGSPSCTSNSDCSSGYYCSAGSCVKCDYLLDGICRVCASELGLTDPDCEEAEPTAAPTIKPSATPTKPPEQKASPTPTETPKASPTAKPTATPAVVTRAEAEEAIARAQDLLGQVDSSEATYLLDLASQAMAAGDYAQAEEYALQAEEILKGLVSPPASGGFDWTLILIVIVIIGAAYYFLGPGKKYYWKNHV